MELDRPDPRPRRRDGTISRFGVIDPTDGGRHARATRSPPSGSGLAARGAHAASALRVATGSISSRTSPTSSTIPSTATSSSRPTGAASSGAQLEPPLAGRWCGRTAENAVGVQLRHDDIAHGRPLPHRGAPAALDTTREDARRRRRAPALFAQSSVALDAVAAHDRRRCARDRYRFDVTRDDRRELRPRRRVAGEPEARR